MTSDMGAFFCSLDTLVRIYDTFGAPMPRHEFLGISEEADKQLSEGVYPMAMDPHPTAMELLDYYSM